MALNKRQKTFLEALKLYLGQDSKLGLKGHDNNKLNDLEKVNGLEFLHNDIYQQFRDKVQSSNLIYVGPIMQAFNKVHSYKYLDSESFADAMKKELTAQGVVSSEIAKAVDILEKLVEDYRNKNGGSWAEKDAGLNANMDEIKEVSQPEQASEFDIIHADINDKNVKDVNDEFA